LNDMVEWCNKILNQASEQQVVLRAIGGLAIRLHSPIASQLPALKRTYGDLDFVTISAHSSGVKSVLKMLGFQPYERFNKVQGKTRLIYYAPDDTWHLDIFIDVFRMCHSLQFTKEELEKDPRTIPLADLWLTKMQVVNLNEKDIKDLATLLLEHSPGMGDNETVNLNRIISILGDDWGFYTTVLQNVDKMLEYLKIVDLTTEQKTTVLGRTLQIKESIEKAPKTARWKLRAVPGKKIPWYNNPEEPTFEAIKLYPDQDQNSH
jgi:hypothetical protein